MLSYFERFGVILRKAVFPDCNWIHLQYQQVYEADRVRIIPCCVDDDQDVVDVDGGGGGGYDVVVVGGGGGGDVLVLV